MKSDDEEDFIASSARGVLMVLAEKRFSEASDAEICPTPPPAVACLLRLPGTAKPLVRAHRTSTHRLSPPLEKQAVKNTCCLVESPYRIETKPFPS